jgi:hypothetical protein
MLCCDTWFPYEFLILSNENLFLISSYEFSYNENSLRDAMFSRSLRTHMRTHYEKHETIFVRVCFGGWRRVSQIVSDKYETCHRDDAGSFSGGFHS